MTIELVPLCTATITLGSPMIIPNTPMGTRLIVEVADARYEGDRLTANLKGVANADWAVIGADNTTTLDVRLTLETDDGALIFLQYQGRSDASGGPGTAPIYAAPRFDTGDPRYAWLNKIQAVAKGTLDGTTLTYEIYELR